MGLDGPPLWYRQLIARILHLAPLKAIGTMAFMAAFFWAYFFVLRNPLAPPVEMPLIAVDHWFGFSPAAFPVYVSLWVYVSLPPALLDNARTLLAYGLSALSMCVFCLLIFWFWPTAVPAAGIDWSAYPQMAVIKSMDQSGNACPSLHVASAVFSCLWLGHLFKNIAAPDWLRVLSLAHCLAILWSTLATRQHVALDVLAGFLVGLLFALGSLRVTRAIVAPGRL